MKNSYCCPKCQSIDVLRIPGESQRHGVGDNIHVGIVRQVLVSKYFCCNCGYIEEWVDQQKDLARIKEYYG